ncbi:hypothetical protein FRC00_003018 [Tulasnella sp. 408]|nr:hypothetical protein FRC00_003018 [Tulasnella sp. 408]
MAINRTNIRIKVRAVAKIFLLDQRPLATRLAVPCRLQQYSGVPKDRLMASSSIRSRFTGSKKPSTLLNSKSTHAPARSSTATPTPVPARQQESETAPHADASRDNTNDDDDSVFITTTTITITSSTLVSSTDNETESDTRDSADTNTTADDSHGAASPTNVTTDSAEPLPTIAITKPSAFYNPWEPLPTLPPSASQFMDEMEKTSNCTFRNRRFEER